MKTSSAKAKGRRAAAKVKEQFLTYAPDLKENDIVVTSSGVTGPDLTLSPAALERFPFVIEVKNQESISIWAALKQAEGHPGDQTKLLCFTRNGAEMYCALKLEDLLTILKTRIKHISVNNEKALLEEMERPLWSPYEQRFDWD